MAKPKNPLKHEAEIGLLTGRLERQKETVKELRTQLKRDTATIHQFRTENIKLRKLHEAELDNKDDIATKLTEALAKNTRERLDLVEQLREAKLVLSHRKSTSIIQEEGQVHVIITDDPYEIKEPSLRPLSDLSRTYRGTSTAPSMANIAKGGPVKASAGVLVGENGPDHLVPKKP